MSIIKNPVILAIIASCLVFVVTYYIYNSNTSIKKKSKHHNKHKTKEGINETIVISSAIAGLATWYIASYYFTETPVSTPDINKEIVVLNNSPIINQQKGGSKISQISTDDVTRSYNLLGSGLNIPKSELKIPKVLIDYK